MDFLHENLPELLPRTLPQLHDESVKNDLKIMPDMFESYDRGIAKDEPGGTSTCEKKFLEALLRKLEEIKYGLFVFGAASNHSERAEERESSDSTLQIGNEGLNLLRLQFEQTYAQISRLRSCVKLFRSIRLRDRFFKLVKQKLGAILRLMNELQAWDKAVENFESEVQAEDQKQQLDKPSWRSTLLWPNWCRNTSKWVTRKEWSDAYRSGSVLPVRIQELPRGARAVMEHWKRDVNEVVASIVTQNDSPEIRLQEATSLDMLVANSFDEKTGQLRRLMKPQGWTTMTRPPHTTNLFTESSMASLATHVEQREDWKVALIGPRSMKLNSYCYLDVESMKAACENFRPRLNSLRDL